MIELFSPPFRSIVVNREQTLNPHAFPTRSANAAGTADGSVGGTRAKALEKLKAQEWERLHSRKLRSFAEVAFQ
jgi:hypothetical protein